MRKRINLCAAIALVAVACGGSAEASSDTVATTSTSAPSPVQTTTTVPATTTTLAEETQGVEEFLAYYYETFADLTLAEPSSLGIVEYEGGYYGALVDGLDSFAESMSGLSPPEEAKREYARGVAVWGEYADLQGSVVGDSAVVGEQLDTVNAELLRLRIIIDGIEVAFNEVAAEALLSLDKIGRAHV